MRSWCTLADKLAELARVGRFLDAPVRQPLDEGARTWRVNATAHEHDPAGEARSDAEDLPVQVHAGHVWHHEVAQDHVEPLAALDAIERVPRLGGDLRVMLVGE